MTSDPPRALPLDGKGAHSLAPFCIGSKTIFIKKEEVTEKRIIGTRFVIAENGLTDGFICLEVNEVISLKINATHLWMTTNKPARFLPFGQSLIEELSEIIKQRKTSEQVRSTH